MNDTIDDAIKALIEKAKTTNQPPIEAVHYTQAALNLAHIKCVLSECRPSPG